jgi:hypothetical protein
VIVVAIVETLEFGNCTATVGAGSVGINNDVLLLLLLLLDK